MAYAPSQISQLLRQASRPNSPQVRGKALERLVAYLFQSVPGITRTLSNTFNPARSQEIDLTFWNTQHPQGFYFLPFTILVECKNWSRPADSEEVAWFDHKLRYRGQSHGIFVAADGITGDASALMFADDIIRHALGQGRHLYIVTVAEIQKLATEDDLVGLFIDKEMALASGGTSRPL